MLFKFQLEPQNLETKPQILKILYVYVYMYYVYRYDLYSKSWIWPKLNEYYVSLPVLHKIPLMNIHTNTRKM